MTRKGVALLLIRTSIAAVLIVWLIRAGKIDFSILFGERFRWGWALCGLFIYSLMSLLGAYRWKWLLAAQEIEIPFWSLFRLTYIGYFFNISMPGATGGDLVKAYYVAHLAPAKKTEAVTSVFFDRVVGLSALAALAFVAVSIYWCVSSRSETVRTLFLCIASALVILLLFTLFLSRHRGDSRFLKWCRVHLPFGKILGRAYDSLLLYRSRKLLLVMALLLSFLAHVVAVCANYFFALALHVEPVSFSVFLFLIPVGIFLDSIPVSIAGLGWGEAAYGILFPLAGYRSTLGTSVAAVMHCAKIIWGLAGSVFYLTRRKSFFASDKADKN
jgi:uncharacterized protein (TIRG00374 family)